MQLAKGIGKYLQREQVVYATIPHARSKTLGDAATACGIPLAHVVRAVLLNDDKGMLLAILPATHMLNFDGLNNELGRNLEPADPRIVAKTFHDCDPGSVPPLAVPYGLAAVIDDSLTRLPPGSDLYFEPGSHETLIYIQSEEFMRLHTLAFSGHISRPTHALGADSGLNFVMPGGATRETAPLAPQPDLKERLKAIDTLPSMPGIASQLLRLRNNPAATLNELAQIIQEDPSLTAQILRYARSPFFGYRGEVEGLDTAIGRVLGFDAVLNMALGLSAGKAFRNPSEGPLGLKAFWQHAVLSATLCQALCQLMPTQMRLKPGLAYLSGLLHNFGHLLLGHLFRSEFFLLNKMVETNPDVPITLIEKRILGIEHTQIGATLMAAWNMPDEIILSMRHHHDEHYRNQHAPYANLVLLADHLLKAYGLGDAAEDTPPPIIYTALGLDPVKVAQVVEHLMETRSVLDTLADQLAA